MKPQEIQDEHRVARYCGKTKLETDLSRPLHTAFMLDDDKPEISVNWLEYYSTECHRAMQQIRDNESLDAGKHARYAILQVSEVRDFESAEMGHQLNVSHTPKAISYGDDKDNPAHADIQGCRCCERDIADELADMVICLAPAR